MKKDIIIVTIDGPSASGKTTVSKLVAEKLGWDFVCTGIFYRSLAYISRDISLDDHELVKKLVNLVSDFWKIEMQKEKTALILHGEDKTINLSSEEIGDRASKISVLPEIRKALLPRQRELIKQVSKGLIAEGRDCGTNVFPKADLKFYLTAKDTTRIRRRIFANQDLAKIQLERDKRDTKRVHSPLAKAAGSIEIDTTSIPLIEVIELVLDHIKKLILPLTFDT